jgi:hypothetical protein
LLRFPFSSLFWVAFVAAACSAAPQPAPRVERFPVYAGEATRLFDDRIDPTAVGLADVAIKPRTDPVLRARTQNAEAVARMRVATVTVDFARGQPIYHLTLTIVDAPLFRRPGFIDNHVEISIRSGAPAFGVVKWLDTRLIGWTFIGFVHRFADPSGLDGGLLLEPQVALRFHLAPDTPDVLAAVREAAMLAEVSIR